MYLFIPLAVHLYITYISQVPGTVLFWHPERFSKKLKNCWRNFWAFGTFIRWTIRIFKAINKDYLKEKRKLDSQVRNNRRILKISTAVWATGTPQPTQSPTHLSICLQRPKKNRRPLWVHPWPLSCCYETNDICALQVFLGCYVICLSCTEQF